MITINKRLANTLIDAAKIRENSYDGVAADKIDDPSVDFSQFYQKTLIQAANKACKNNGIDAQTAKIIDLLLAHCWNDALGWADEVLDNR